MKCPNCGLENPGETLRCDCGYSFPPQQGQPSVTPTPRESRAICARLNVIALLLVVALLFSVGQVFLNRAVPEQWQYTIVSPKDEELKSAIDKLGADGWELILARRASDGNQISPTMSYEMIFKKRGAAVDTPAAIPR